MTPGVFACCGLVGGWGHADVCRCVHKFRQGAPQPICDLGKWFFAALAAEIYAHFLPCGRPSGSVDQRRVLSVNHSQSGLDQLA